MLQVCPVGGRHLRWCLHFVGLEDATWSPEKLVLAEVVRVPIPLIPTFGLRALVWLPSSLPLTVRSLVFEDGILFWVLFLFPPHDDVKVVRITYVSHLVQAAI